MTMKRRRDDSLGDCDSDVWQSARLHGTLEVGCCDAGDPVPFKLLGFGESGNDRTVRFEHAPLFFIDEGLTKNQQQPIAIRDEGVVKKFAELVVLRCGRMLFDCV